MAGFVQGLLLLPVLLPPGLLLPPGPPPVALLPPTIRISCPGSTMIVIGFGPGFWLGPECALDRFFLAFAMVVLSLWFFAGQISA